MRNRKLTQHLIGDLHFMCPVTLYWNNVVELVCFTLYYRSQICRTVYLSLSLDGGTWWKCYSAAVLKVCVGEVFITSQNNSIQEIKSCVHFPRKRCCTTHLPGHTLPFPSWAMGSKKCESGSKITRLKLPKIPMSFNFLDKLSQSYTVDLCELNTLKLSFMIQYILVIIIMIANLLVN